MIQSSYSNRRCLVEVSKESIDQNLSKESRTIHRITWTEAQSTLRRRKSTLTMDGGRGSKASLPLARVWPDTPLTAQRVGPSPRRQLIASPRVRADIAQPPLLSPKTVSLA